MADELQHFDANITLPDFEISSLRAHLMNSALQTSAYRWILNRGKLPTILCYPPDLWSGSADDGLHMLDGYYKLRGQKFNLAGEPWRKGGLPLEASTFQWLRDLHATGGEDARHLARRLTQSWINSNQKLSSLAWQPYVAAERAVLWLQHYSFFAEGADEAFQEQLIRLLILHLYRLRSQYYSDYPDDDKLLIIKAIMYITGCLNGYESWFETAEECLDHYLTNNLDEQFQEHNKSISSQMETILHLLDIRLLYQTKKYRVPAYIKNTLCQMAGLLKRTQMSNGTLPSFHATPRYERTWLNTILNMAGQSCHLLQPYHGSVMGLEKIISKNTCIAIDTLVPSKNTFRYHASPLAFEMTLGKNALIVNCGYSSTLASEWKIAMRKTSAHSTLSIDDADAFDYGISGEKTLSHLEKNIVEDGGRLIFTGRHDGYFGRFGILHQRRLTLSRNGDNLSGYDLLKGAEGHKFCIRFHLSPHIRPIVEASKNRVYLDAVNQEMWTLTSPNMPITIEDSIFIDQNGNIKPTSQVVISGITCAGNTDIAWVLQKA